MQYLLTQEEYDNHIGPAARQKLIQEMRTSLAAAIREECRTFEPDPWKSPAENVAKKILAVVNRWELSFIKP